MRLCVTGGWRWNKGCGWWAAAPMGKSFEVKWLDCDRCVCGRAHLCARHTDFANPNRLMLLFCFFFFVWSWPEEVVCAHARVHERWSFVIVFFFSNMCAHVHAHVCWTERFDQLVSLSFFFKSANLSCFCTPPLRYGPLSQSGWRERPGSVPGGDLPRKQEVCLPHGCREILDPDCKRRPAVHRLHKVRTHAPVLYLCPMSAIRTQMLLLFEINGLQLSL